MRATWALMGLVGCAAFTPPSVKLTKTPDWRARSRVVTGGAVTRSAVDEFVGESVGSFVLTTFGFGVVCSNSFTAGAVGLPALATVWGLGVALGIKTSAKLSGAHLNPAMTLVFAAFRNFPLAKVPRYVAAQLTGMMAASVLQFVTWRSVAPAGMGAFPHIMAFGASSPAKAAFVEGWATAILSAAILLITHPKNPCDISSGSVPYWIGATVAGLITLVGPVTSAGFNPARDLAPRLVAVFSGVGRAAAFPRGWWVYTVGPTLGAFLGAALVCKLVESLEPQGPSDKD